MSQACAHCLVYYQRLRTFAGGNREWLHAQTKCLGYGWMMQGGGPCL